MGRCFSKETISRLCLVEHSWLVPEMELVWKEKKSFLEPMVNYKSILHTSPCILGLNSTKEKSILAQIIR